MVASEGDYFFYFSLNINCSEQLGSKVDTRKLSRNICGFLWPKRTFFLREFPEPDIRLLQVFMRNNRSKSCYFLFWTICALNLPKVLENFFWICKRGGKNAKPPTCLRTIPHALSPLFQAPATQATPLLSNFKNKLLVFDWLSLGAWLQMDIAF